MGKGGSKSTTTVQEVKIPDFAKDQLMETFDLARDYKPTVYDGPRVADFTDAERQMQSNLMAYSQGPNALQQAASDTITGIASGNMGLNTNALQSQYGATTDMSPLQQQLSAQNAALDPLQSMTSAQTTPYLQAAIQNAATAAADGVTSQFATSGRLGSGAFGNSLGSGIVNAQAPILAEYAQNEANRQLQAAQALGQVSGQDLNRQAQLANNMVGANQADLVRQAGLAGDLTNASGADLANRMKAAGMSGQMQQQDLQRIGLAGMVGEAQRAMAQAQLTGDQQAIAEANAADQARLNAMLSAAGVGQGTYGQTSTQTAPKSGGIGSSLGGIGSLLSGGAQVAGILGFSDMRMKENIKLIGKTEGGHNIYEWEWNETAHDLGVDLGPNVGVMAQEVRSTNPEAVVMHESGYLMVDYGAIA